MIRQRDKFSFSEFFYAINFDSINNSNSVFTTVDAIWFKKKDGIVAVCKGTLWAMTSNSQTVDDFIMNFDGRGGGNTHFKWNGTEMWSVNNVFLDMIEVHRELDPILRNFPAIPEGYTGWHSIK